MVDVNLGADTFWLDIAGVDRRAGKMALDKLDYAGEYDLDTKSPDMFDQNISYNLIR